MDIVKYKEMRSTADRGVRHRVIETKYQVPSPYQIRSVCDPLASCAASATQGNQILSCCQKDKGFSDFGGPLKEEGATDTFSKLLEIYTDGSCRMLKGGYGVVFINKDSENPVTEIHGSIPITPCTNQISELYAIMIALYHINNNFLSTDSKLDHIVIYSDSKYAINCSINWIDNWKHNGWLTAKRKPVENRQLIEDIDFLINSLKNKKITIKFKHVFGHSGNRYNEIADRLANIGREE